MRLRDATSLPSQPAGMEQMLLQLHQHRASQFRRMERMLLRNAAAPGFSPSGNRTHASADADHQSSELGRMVSMMRHDAAHSIARAQRMGRSALQHASCRLVHHHAEWRLCLIARPIAVHPARRHHNRSSAGTCRTAAPRACRVKRFCVSAHADLGAGERPAAAGWVGTPAHLARDRAHGHIEQPAALEPSPEADARSTATDASRWRRMTCACNDCPNSHHQLQLFRDEPRFS